SLYSHTPWSLNGTTTLEKKGYYAIEIDSFVAIDTICQGATADVSRGTGGKNHLRKVVLR
ncbi:MAG TPA: hypothetical protein VHV32_02160, partial [Candidatus Angelobacter sp.]|nr:hypothetical protein [Candidatus Angelobacter sp.]